MIYLCELDFLVIRFNRWFSWKVGRKPVLSNNRTSKQNIIWPSWRAWRSTWPSQIIKTDKSYCSIPHKLYPFLLCSDQENQFLTNTAFRRIFENDILCHQLPNSFENIVLFLTLGYCLIIIIVTECCTPVKFLKFPQNRTASAAKFVDPSIMSNLFIYHRYNGFLEK